MTGRNPMHSDQRTLDRIAAGRTDLVFGALQAVRIAHL